MFDEIPLHVRPVCADDELRQVAALRSLAYRSAAPELADRLREPEPEDHLPGNVVFGAYDPSGALHGTVRVHTSAYRPLPLERSVQLPEGLMRPRAEATRLARGFRAHPMVKLALTKAFGGAAGATTQPSGAGLSFGVEAAEPRPSSRTAFWTTCLHRGVEVMVVAGRDPVHAQYERLLFSPVFPEWIPMAHAGGLPHKVLALAVEDALRGWRERAHPLLSFMVGDGVRIELPSEGFGVAAA
ncbi:MAG: hypothetical protein ABMA64_11765 [Myxococcota bacterium]